MSDCEKYIAMISAQADSELSPEEEAELRRHLEKCPSCRKVRDAFAAISGALEEELVPAPENLASSVMDKINGKKKARHIRLHTWSRYVAVAACAALIFFSASRSMPFTEIDHTISAPADNNYDASGFDDEGAMGQSVPNAPESYKSADSDNAANGGEAVKTTDSGVRADSGDTAQPEEDVTVVPLELNDQELLNLAEGFDSEALSKKLDELFSSRTAALYGGEAYAELIVEGSVYPFFTFTDAASASPLRSFIGQVYVESNQLTGIPSETPLITIRLYDGSSEDCFITVWTGDTIVCLLTEGLDKTIFTADGNPEVLSTFISELMNLSVS